MKIIKRYFAISLFTQVILLAFIWLTGWLDVVMYVFYLFPWAILNLLSPSAGQLFEINGFLAFGAILGVPAAIYSLILALSVYGIKKIRSVRKLG